MKAINQREHQLLSVTIDQLINNSGQIDIEPMLKHEQQQLSGIFKTYQSLLTQLAECIAEYENKRHDIKVNLVAPALRKAQKELQNRANSSSLSSQLI